MGKKIDRFMIKTFEETKLWKVFVYMFLLMYSVGIISGLFSEYTLKLFDYVYIGAVSLIYAIIMVVICKALRQ